MQSTGSLNDTLVQVPERRQAVITATAAALTQLHAEHAGDGADGIAGLHHVRVADGCKGQGSRSGWSSAAQPGPPTPGSQSQLTSCGVDSCEADGQGQQQAGCAGHCYAVGGDSKLLSGVPKEAMHQVCLQHEECAHGAWRSV